MEQLNGSTGPLAAHPEPPAGLGPEDFRRALARCAAGVVVVTVADGPTGMTASSFTSVSQSPPLVSFCVDRRSSSRLRLCAAEHFAVNVLTAGQADVAAVFARRDTDRFALTRWRRGRYGLPLLEDAAAHLACRTYRIVPLGDHLMIVGLLVDAEHPRPDPPLVYHRGAYGRFEPDR
ncbi:hypothetical protein CIK06_11000 [Plantactinospora sp. KBS50]|nr:hypothetical protein CIK06_11000 [Plantactinospora sp. KBS50]